jgi:hypothetical protein
MNTTETKPTPKGAQLADDLADLFPLVPDSDRWGSYYNQSDEPGDDSIDAWQQREARFLALVNSAPELLQACRELCRWHDAKEPDRTLGDVVTDARAAIAKATGQN